VPKINVYLPDDLARAVRRARVPVSAVCQQALEEAVRRVTAVTEATSARGSAAFAGRGPFTDRLRRSLTRARDESVERGHGWVGTEHLLLGMLGERRNLGVAVLEALDVDLQELRATVDALIEESAGKASEADAATEAGAATASLSRQAELRLTPRAEAVLRLAQEEALKMGHNYVGCEHLLLGLLNEEEGVGGRALRVSGAEPTAVRNQVLVQLTGYALGRRHFRGQRRVARRWAELDPVTRATVIGLAEPVGSARVEDVEEAGAAEQGADVGGVSGVGAKLDEVLQRLEALERRLAGGTE